VPHPYKHITASPSLVCVLCHSWVPQMGRPRRNRKSEVMRSMVRENIVLPSNFIYPLFIHDEVRATWTIILTAIALPPEEIGGPIRSFVEMIILKDHGTAQRLISPSSSTMRCAPPMTTKLLTLRDHHSKTLSPDYVGSDQMSLGAPYTRAAH
jgi:hypothetical protein